MKREIPGGYGDNKIILMARDPHTLFSYWEVQPGVLHAAEEDIRKKGQTHYRRILRVYQTDGDMTAPTPVMDLEINDYANSWYINGVDPGRKWIIDIGLLYGSGEFFTLARSNVTITPSNRMAEVSDAEWMSPKGLYGGLSCGSDGEGIGQSSIDFPSSDSISSRMSGSSGSFVFGE